MTVFIVAIAVLVAIALSFVVPALAFGRSRQRVSRDAVNAAVYRDQLRELEADVAAGTLSQQDYDKARRELEARLLADVATVDSARHAPARGVKSAVAAGIVVPLLAGAVYFSVGTPHALSPVATAPGDPGHDVTAEQIVAMVDKLAARLKQDPSDGEGWAMLGRAYGVLGRLDEAAVAYRNAVERIPDNARLLTDYADALALSRGRNLEGEPEKLLSRALEIAPDDPKALALAGTAAFKRGDYERAVKLWERLHVQLPADTEIAKAVQGSIEEARAALKAPGGARVK